jgi:hypothetical protein
MVRQVWKGAKASTQTTDVAQVHGQHGNYFATTYRLLSISIYIYVSRLEPVASRDGSWTGIGRALGLPCNLPLEKSSRHHVHLGNCG